ncbi:hypothetical protein [Marivirga sp.]|uniref:hypothetical protein n=1 Tax=Marivirga sp. TaxID=2018662 RepID=UPI002D7FEA38|nr:hypothetical protein [Marivirga sp.]HET8859330.1 hypothetical protein [Marivirga sp.]
MLLSNLNKEYLQTKNPKLKKRVEQFEQLVEALSEKEITASIEKAINTEIEKLNNNQSKSSLPLQFQKSIQEILKVTEKELNLVAENHYTFLWIVLGMAAFGLPIGILVALALDNLAFMSMGLGIGMAIGVGVGAQKDKQAKIDGKQIAFRK